MDGRLPLPLPVDGVFVPPLTAEEIEYYRWLIAGLMAGSCRLAALPDGEESAARAMVVALDLFDEMTARIPALQEIRLKDLIELGLDGASA
jgi:hypothetical protein